MAVARCCCGKWSSEPRLVKQFAACFRDYRSALLVEHSLDTLIGQRVTGLALGYEDLNDHDQLRNDPLMAALVGKADSPACLNGTRSELALARSVATRPVHHVIAGMLSEEGIDHVRDDHAVVRAVKPKKTLDTFFEGVRKWRASPRK